MNQGLTLFGVGFMILLFIAIFSTPNNKGGKIV